MAFATKYRAQFTDDLGRAVEIRFDLDGHTGGITPFRTSDPNYVRQDGRQNGPLFGVVPSALEVVLHSTAEFVEADIYSGGTWRLQITRDGKEHFYGPVQRSQRIKPRGLFKPTLRLTANCGLAGLDDLAFATDAEATTLASVGRQPLTYWLLWCLNKTGLQRPLYVASEKFAEAMNGSADPLGQEYLPWEVWQGLSARQALEDILGGKVAVLHGRDGAWHCYTRRSLFSPTFTRWRYEWDHFSVGGTATSDTYSAHVVVADPGIRVLKGGKEPVLGARAGVEVAYAHGKLDSLLPNHSLNESEGFAGSLAPKHWTLDGAAAYAVPTSVDETVDAEGTVNRSVRLPILQTDLLGADLGTLLSDTGSATSEGVFIEAEAVQELLLSPRMFAELTDEARGATGTHYTFEAALRVTFSGISGTIWYLNRDLGANDGTWQTTFTHFTYSVPAEDWATRTIRVPQPPEDGTLSVQLLAGVDGKDQNFEGRVPAGQYLWWDDVRLLIVTAEGSENIAVSRWTAQDTSQSGPSYPAITLRHGTGPSSAHAGASRDADGALLDDWRFGAPTGTPSGLTAAQLTARDVLDQVRSDLVVLRLTYTRHVQPSPILAVNEGGRIYLPAYVRYNGRTCEPQVEAPELRLDGFLPSYAFLGEEGAVRLGPRDGSGAALFVDSLNDAIAQLSGINAVALLADDVGPGVVDTLPIAPALAGTWEAFAAERRVAVSGLRGGVWEFVMREAGLQDDAQLLVQPLDLGTVVMPKGSGVHPIAGELLNVQTQTRQATYNVIRGDGLTRLAEDLDGDVSQIVVEATAEQALPGTRLLVQRDDGAFFELWLTQNAPRGTKLLHVNGQEPEFQDVFGGDGKYIRTDLLNPVPAHIEAGAGAVVKVPDVHRQSESLQTADTFLRLVTRDEFDALEAKVVRDFAEIATLLDETSQSFLDDEAGNPLITFGDDIRAVVPQNVSAITQNANSITAVVAGVDTNQINLASLDVRVDGTESSVSLLSAHLTSATEIASVKTSLTVAGNPHTQVVLWWLDMPLAVGDVIRMLNVDGVEEALTVSAPAEASALNVTVQVLAYSVSADVPVNAVVYTRNSTFSRIEARASEIEANIVLKVNSNGHVASVALSADPDTGSVIDIEADQINVTGVTTFKNGLTLAQNINAGSTTINGDKVRTGKLQSNNWSASAGSEFDLDAGTFSLGGSSNPALVFTGSSLIATGEFKARQGFGIGDNIVELKTSGFLIRQEANPVPLRRFEVTPDKTTWYDANQNPTADLEPDHLGTGLSNLNIDFINERDPFEADTLNGQSGPFYQNASNLNAGTIPDARLSSSVALFVSDTVGAPTADHTLRISINGNQFDIACTKLP